MNYAIKPQGSFGYDKDDRKPTKQKTIKLKYPYITAKLKTLQT